MTFPFYKKEKSSGFTLIELLVVIAIIGVLASVVLASLNSAREKARDAKRLADINQIKLALELYYDSTGSYPAVCSPPYLLNQLSTHLRPYIPNIPTDPSFAETIVYGYCGGYLYNNANGYNIRVRFETPGKFGSEQSGYCKTGVNGRPGDWGAATPYCVGI